MFSKSYVLQKKNVDFVRRGDAQYWNPTALATESTLKNIGGMPLSEVVNIPKDALTPRIGTLYNLIELADIDGNSGLTKYRKVKGHHIDSNKFKIPKDSVLFGRLRFYLKNIGISPVDSICSTEIRPIVPYNKNYPPEYIFLYLRTKYVHDILIERSGGSNHPRIDDYDLENLPIVGVNEACLKMATQQTQTAFKLFADAQGEYTKAREIINNHLGIPINKEEKKYTSYVLWRKEVNITQSLDSGYWTGENDFFKDSIRMKDVSDRIITGRTPAWGMYSNSSGVRILKVRHLSNEALSWDLKQRDYVHPLFYNKNVEASVQIHDILLASAAHQSSYIGKDVSIVDYFPPEIDKAIVCAELNLIRPNSEIINPFVLCVFMQQKIFYNEIQRNIHGQTGHLYPDEIRKLPVPQKLQNKNFPNRDIVEKLYKSSASKTRESRALIKEAVEAIEKEIDDLINLKLKETTIERKDLGEN